MNGMKINTMSKPMISGDPIICAECKNIWIGRVEVCNCGCSSLMGTHPSNDTKAQNNTLWSFIEILSFMHSGEFDVFDVFVDFYDQTKEIHLDTDSNGEDKLILSEFSVQVTRPRTKDIYYINWLGNYMNLHDDYIGDNQNSYRYMWLRKK